MNMQLHKEVISMQKQQAVKKCAAPKCQGDKRCEIKGGGQEMAVIVASSMAKNLIMTIQVNLVQGPMEEDTQIPLNCRY